MIFMEVHLDTQYFLFFLLVRTQLNRKVFRRLSTPCTAVHVRNMNFPNSVHVTIVLVICWWSLQSFVNAVHQLFHWKPGTIAVVVYWCFVEEWWARQILMLERAVACLANQVNLRIQLNIWQHHLDSFRYRWTGTLSSRLEFRH